MHSQEWNDLVECCDCGATLSGETDRPFAMSDDDFLCFECAVRRGGVFDTMQERWIVSPNVADLPDERRAHP
jgi:hypothetical protein